MTPNRKPEDDKYQILFLLNIIEGSLIEQTISHNICKREKEQTKLQIQKKKKRNGYFCKVAEKQVSLSQILGTCNYTSL